ncbi:MAG: GGDEF domain-containing protein [Thermotogae bacterium]|nr:GGDEF domain-containing protein [Thermotogota bacterium]
MELSDEQISNLLKNEVEKKTLEYVREANWYLLSPEGVIERTNYLPDLGLNIAKVVPRYWKNRLKPIQPQDIVLESVNFEIQTNRPRIFGYKRLSNNWILEIGLALDQVIVDDLWRNLGDLIKNLDYVKDIRLYSISFIPFGDAEELSKEDKKFFSKSEAENSFIVRSLGNSRFVIYKNFIPIDSEGKVDWSGKNIYMTARAMSILDFGGLELFKKVITWSFSFIIIAVTFLEILVSTKAFENISKSFSTLLKHVKKFQENPLDPNLKNYNPNSQIKIKEIYELENAFYQMENRISEQMISQKLINDLLQKDLERYSEVENQLKKEVFTDSLTGLYNRRYLLNKLEEIIEKADINQEKLVICFIDVDDLKKINDSFGHIIGDRVLKIIGQTIHEVIRKDDVLARIGGDEFAVLFYNKSIEEAKKAIERVELALRDINLPDFPELRISISYGFAEWDSEGPVSIEDLLRKADIEMYKQKFDKKASRG